MSIDHSPTAATGQRCQCGHVVSQQFIRVFGRDGALYACLECSTREALHQGAGGDPDFERRVEAPLPEARKRRGDSGRAVGGAHR